MGESTDIHLCEQLANGDVEINDINISQMDPEEIRVNVLLVSSFFFCFYLIIVSITKFSQISVAKLHVSYCGSNWRCFQHSSTKLISNFQFSQMFAFWFKSNYLVYFSGFLK